jgi:hypothetical protein
MKTVTESAMLRRINRALAKEGLRMHKARNPTPTDGRFYVVEEMFNRLDAWGIDTLDDWALECGCLRPGEVID